MRKSALLAAAAAAAVFPVSALALSADDFETTPFFEDTFAGGSPTGLWELDPGNLEGSDPPQFVSATPGNIAASFIAADPLADATDGGAMLVGNEGAENFGLNYVLLVNTQEDGGGIDLVGSEETEKIRMVARVWLPSAEQVNSERFQVGPFAYGGDLFRPGPYYNTSSVGEGPGWGHRGTGDGGSGSTVLETPGELTEGEWRLMSLMIDPGDDPDRISIAFTVDVNGDGILDEDDPDEHFNTELSYDADLYPHTSVGFFTVGEVSNDEFPFFVDRIALFLPADPTPVDDWQLYH